MKKKNLKWKGMEIFPDKLFKSEKWNMLVVDDGTQYIQIPTPKGWICERKNCPTDYLHTHSTYPTLNAEK